MRLKAREKSQQGSMKRALGLLARMRVKRKTNIADRTQYIHM